MICQRNEVAKGLLSLLYTVRGYRATADICLTQGLTVFQVAQSSWPTTLDNLSHPFKVSASPSKSPSLSSVLRLMKRLAEASNELPPSYPEFTMSKQEYENHWDTKSGGFATIYCCVTSNRTSVALKVPNKLGAASITVRHSLPPPIK